MKRISFGKLIFLLPALQSLACILSPAHGQNTMMGKVSISSPTAASLGKYADVPVNYHTGIPQIAIPLYTVKVGPLELPISLSYHASGLKSQEPASWVGAGWALNAGGVITRTVMGAPDEAGSANSPQTRGFFSHYGLDSYLFQEAGNAGQDWQGFIQGRKDGEPDLFFFNFNGYSGKFYFNDDRTPMLVPEADLKISYVYPDPNSSGIESNIQGFIVTTPDGVKYLFGNTPGVSGAAPIEITNSVTGKSGYSFGNTISSWYLNKIVSADDQFTIKLAYTQEKYGYHALANIPVDPHNPDRPEFDYDLVKNIIQGVRLSSISFPNGSVTFNPGQIRTDLSDKAIVLPDSDNDEASALGSINISNSDGFCKKFNFLTSYFTDDATPLRGYLSISQYAFYNLHTDRKRLRLDQVHELSCNNLLTVQPHTFSYFPEPVTRRLSFGVDHWGFMNGETGNSEMVPTYYVVGSSNTTTVSGANREPAFPRMRGGTLEKITYPTGGSTTFNFEPNDAYTSSTSNTYASISGAMFVRMYGQSAFSQTFPFTSNGTVMALDITSTSNYSGNFMIRNSTNQVVYTTPVPHIPPNQSSYNFQTTLNLPSGTYQAILSLPANVSPHPTPTTGGLMASIYQWQTQTSNTNIIIGGLRIKAITHDNGGSNTNSVISYNYKSGQQSTGVLYSRPVYVGIIRNDLIKNVGYWTTNGFQPSILNSFGCTSGIDATYFITGGSLRPMETTQGYHIGYREVQVTQSGNGSSKYEYYGTPVWQNAGEIAIRSVNITGCDGSAPNYPTAPILFEYKRGQLKYEAQLNEAGQILKDIYYTYTFQDNPVTTRAAIFTLLRTHPLGTFYAINTARKIETSMLEKTYVPGGENIAVTTNVFHESAFHNQVTRKIITKSIGNVSITKTKYAQDFRVAVFDGIANGWAVYTNALNSCQLQYISESNLCGSNPSQCNTTAYLNNLKCKNDARISYINYRKINFTNPSNNFQYQHDIAKGAADANLKPILELQDMFINTPIEVSEWKNDKLLRSTFNKYDYAINPAGFVYPKVRELIHLAAPSTTYTYASSTDNSISKDGRYTSEDTYVFTKGQLTQLNTRDGLTTSYLYGYNNIYPVAEVLGADHATISSLVNQNILDNANGQYTEEDLHTQFAALRSGLSSTKALITTFTYKPLVGITSQTNNNGIKSHYEYDALGRLSNIRDQDRKIVKRFEYNYGNNRCGENCYLLQMQTFTEYKTPGYPVGVFNVNKEYIGTAIDKDEYLRLWNFNVANKAVGILRDGGDPEQFQLILKSGSSAPLAVFGLRYYQFNAPAPSNVLLGTDQMSFVDWGDGNRELLTSPRFPIIDEHLYDYAGAQLTGELGYYSIEANHLYSNTQARVITVFHNETTEEVTIRNTPQFNMGVNDATDDIDIRGNYPEKVKRIGYYGISNSSDVRVSNFLSLTEIVSVGYYFEFSSTTKHNNWQNLTNAHKLKWVKMYFKNGEEIMPDIKTNFPNLSLCDFHYFKPAFLQDWAAGSFPKMKIFYYINSPGVSLTSQEVELMLNRLLANQQTGGSLYLDPATSPTAAGIQAIGTLRSRGWKIIGITN